MITRANLIAGPARLVRGAGSVHTKDSFTVNLQKSTFPIVLEGYGQVTERSEDLIVSAQFTPDGRWNAATRAFLWPWLNPTIGADPFTSADVPTVIHDVNAHAHTIIASAVTQMPSLFLSAAATMVGPCTITGIRGTGLAYGALASYYTVATSGGTFTDTGFVPSEIKVQPYTGSWTAVSGLTSIESESGWTVEFNLGVGFMKTDNGGTSRAAITGVSALARCTPVGLTTADILTAFADANRGASVHQGDLVITGADSSTIITLKNAGLVQAGFRFGASVLRDNELGFVSARTFTSGAPGAIATFA
jgi:hypothetical protein